MAQRTLLKPAGAEGHAWGRPTPHTPFPQEVCGQPGRPGPDPLPASHSMTLLSISSCSSPAWP